MSSSLEGATQLLARGADLGPRLEGLAQAVDAAQGRLDEGLLQEAREVVERTAGRLRLSAEHTVVAIAGATGSGKSSTFNALTGLELSAVGVRRPTTSWATACVWGADGAQEVLEWLGIAPRHQTTRDSMLDTRKEGNALDGVVLLDLPDHDSTEVAHHLEVDRLVKLADMLVWVLDPQKYADAAIHDRYLAPLTSHEAVMVVVLNHIDTVAEDRRQSMLDDVSRLLVADGLHDVPVIGISAREGIGLDALRAEIERRVTEKKATRDRVEADIRAIAAKLDEASGRATARTVSGPQLPALEDAFSEAAGVPTVVDAVERSSRIRVHRATGWPVTAWISRLRPDPLKRLQLDLGAAGSSLKGGASSPAPSTTSVQRARIDTEVRAVADTVSHDLGPAWSDAVRTASVARLPEIGDRLDAAVASVDLDASKIPVWAGIVRVLQWLLVLTAVGSGAWAIALTAGGTLDEATQVGGIALPLALLLGAVALGVVLAVGCRGLAGGAARSRASRADERLRSAVSEVARELVVEPIDAELTAYSRVRAGLGKALA
ncbi:MAG: ABC transporter [Actinobacteria bacterium]|uniref:Unannotated protein n=1 Tax=freshwater metagenome TaxID=449393 RepID=A0A6J6P3U4_9ZZZZ|nr:ABC transporter [Actinomycetota bacterium]